MEKVTDPARIAPQDFQVCREILWEGSKSFYAAYLLLPPSLRRDSAAIYALCRLADDSVDEGESGQEALQDLRKRLHRIYHREELDHPVDRAFASVVARWGIPREIPEALIEGFQWDLEGRRYATLSELRAYCARVASAVGLMMTLTMGERREAVMGRACDLGIAMQLTNIARDVAEDARIGRLYLPLDWLREEGLEPEAVLQPSGPDPAVIRVVDRLLIEADRLYRRADAGLRLLPWAARVGIRTARLVYAEIGREVRRAGTGALRRRAFTSRRRKLALQARAMGILFWPRPKEDVLHRPALPEVEYMVQSVLECDRGLRAAELCGDARAGEGAT